MFERLARQEEQHATREERRDVFKEATEQEIKHQSELSETNSLPITNQVTSSTEVKGGNADVEMKEDVKGGVIC